MSDQLRDFARRHKQVQRKHRRLAQGYVTKLDRHGVIRHVPRRDYGGVLAMPLAILVLAFFGFKAMLMSGLSPQDYQMHLDALAQGNLAEKVGARLMSRDPLTELLVGLWRSIG
ncbi:hypothetical protein ATO8_17715 [Roseivivax marinus]|jgi:hypothetical protein|uniref:Uncharacterized protein n=1 Tax=Roseivivax marinus TaxID=1379903 RepID=W4HF45_9RHOB|nr:hypothetical protein [Roseivivax marinus]ETW11329.1 hypothetical protein ATO8_17715 [Roseivivax marinus]UMA64140.1 hypothetical protein LVO79_14075 [Roseivivax marinus]